MRIVVAAMLTALSVAALTAGIYGVFANSYVIPSLILCVIVGGICSVAAGAAFTENVLWRPLAYAAAVITLGFVGIALARIGYVSWVQPAVLVYGVAISVLTWAAPLQPRRSRQDHLASSAGRTW